MARGSILIWLLCGLTESSPTDRGQEKRDFRARGVMQGHSSGQMFMLYGHLYFSSGAKSKHWATTWTLRVGGVCILSKPSYPRAHPPFYVVVARFGLAVIV